MDNSLAHGTYALKQVIGRGAYGVVYRAVKRGTNKPCAIKQIEFEDESELNEHMLEIDLLKNLRNQNIVEYRGFIQKSHELYIILEYCSRGSLRDILKHGPLLEDDTVNYVTQTLHGLRYLHEQGVIHRDIKAANLLLTEDGVVKLADFGVSTRINRMAMTYAGSPNWMAPEVMTGQGASTVSDTWSLGATVVELLTGNPPFHNLVNESACYAIVNEEYIAPLTLSAECRDFLARCFQKNMFKRATAQELLEHSWLNRIRKPKSKINLAEYVEKDDKWDVDFVLDSNTDMTPSPTKSPVQEHLVPADFKTLSVDQLFIEHSTDSIVVELIKSLCETLTATGNVGSMEFVNTRTLDVLKYDRQFNHSALKKKFIENGGLPLLISLRLETVLLTFFDKNVKLLIQCGILSQFSDLKNPKLIVLVSYHYRSLTSHDMWNRWCLSYKSKISSAVNTELTSTKCNEAEKLLLHISMVKDFPLDISKLMILAKRYTHLQNCTFTSLNNSIKRTIVNVPTSNLIHGKLFYEKSNFAQSITQWLLEMIPQVVYKATEPFVELCFHVCHLNNKSITLLMKDGLFLALTKRLLKSSSNSSLPWCLNLCSEYAKKLKADHIGTMIEIGVSSLSIANCLPNSIEIILNCYNVAQQIDLPIVVHKETITIGKYNVPLDLLVASFYQDNGRFDKYITKYTKFCSLPVGSQVCVEVLDQERFIGRIHELFGRFKTSLIIQIDLLKFLKVLVIQINEQGTSSEDEKLQVLSKFLTSNWNSKENFTPIKQGHQRVGADSVLIQQLCQDIQHLIGV